MAPSLFGVIFVVLCLGNEVDSKIDDGGSVTLNLKKTYFLVEPKFDYVDIPIDIKMGSIMWNFTVKLYKDVANGPDVLVEELGSPSSHRDCHKNLCTLSFRAPATEKAQFYYLKVSSISYFQVFWRFYDRKNYISRSSPLINVERKDVDIQLTAVFPRFPTGSGRRVFAKCKTGLAKPVPEIVWKTNGGDTITDGGFYHVFSQTIPDAKVSGSGYSQSMLYFFARREDLGKEFFCALKDKPEITSAVTSINFKVYNLSVEVKQEYVHKVFLKLSCQVTSKITETPTFQWIFTGNAGSLEISSTSEYYQIMPDSSHDGDYTCHVNTEIGTGSASYKFKSDGSAQSFESHEMIVNDGPVQDRGSSVLTGSAWAVFAVFIAFAILVATVTGFVTFKKWSKGTGKNLLMEEVRTDDTGRADNLEVVEEK